MSIRLSRRPGTSRDTIVDRLNAVDEELEEAVQAGDEERLTASCGACWRSSARLATRWAPVTSLRRI